MASVGARGAVGLSSCATGVARLDTSLSLIALAGALYLPFTPFACLRSMNMQRRSRVSATLPRHARRYVSTLATTTEGGESRRNLFAFSSPEQQLLGVIKQHPMSATELDEDNIIAPVRRTRYQAPAAYLGITRFHAGKYRRSDTPSENAPLVVFLHSSVAVDYQNGIFAGTNNLVEATGRR